MATGVDASTLGRQPKQRRTVYHLLEQSEGSSVKDLLHESSVPEPDLRETLRRLEAAGLAQRSSRSIWVAVPIEPR